MKASRSIFINAVVVLLMTSALFYFSEQGFLERLRLGGLDLLFRLRAEEVINTNIVIVEIDDDNLTKIGRWPWERKWHGALIRALKEFGAKQIYLDVICSEPSTEEDDTIFDEAIKEAGNVYLPFSFQSHEPDLDAAFFPTEKLSQNIRGTGSINIEPDLDGYLRRIPLFFELGESVYPHVALIIAMHYMGAEIEEIKEETLVLSNDEGNIEIPLVDGNKMLVNWLGKWGTTYKHYSFLDVLIAYDSYMKGEDPGINIEPFKDSICLVAVTAMGLYDIKSTAMDAEHPGIGVSATATSNILNQRFITWPPPWVGITILYLFCLVPFFISSGERPLRSMLLLITIALAFILVVMLLFKQNVWIEYTLPLIVLFLSYTAVATFDFVRISIERQKFFKMAVTDGLTGLANIRYFMMVLKAEQMMAAKDKTKKYCIAMTDIDHFKKFNDTYGHAIGDLVLKEVANVIKHTVRASDLVARYGGEEIIVLLRDAGIDNAMHVARKIRENVENLEVKGDQDTYHATLSLGVASLHPGESENDVIKRADEGLYVAKETGRNKVCTKEEE